MAKPVANADSTTPREVLTSTTARSTFPVKGRHDTQAVGASSEILQARCQSRLPLPLGASKAKGGRYFANYRSSYDGHVERIVTGYSRNSTRTRNGCAPIPRAHA